MTMTSKISDVATITTKKHLRQEVTFSEFEPLLNQLRNSNDITQGEAAKLIGYDGSAISGWKSSHAVPVVALNSVKWVLHTRNEKINAPKPKISLSFDEQASLFGILQGFEAPIEIRRNLTKKLAAMLMAEE